MGLIAQGSMYLQILPDVFGTIYALILKLAEPLLGMKSYRGIGIAQLPQDDGMADDREDGCFYIILL